jgi:hypothetical protein
VTHPKIERLEAAILVFREFESLLPVGFQIHEQQSQLDENGLYCVSADIGDSDSDDPYQGSLFSLALDTVTPEGPRMVLNIDFDGRRAGEREYLETVSLEFTPTAGATEEAQHVWKIKLNMGQGMPRSEPFIRFQRLMNLPDVAERTIPADGARAFGRLMIDFMVDELHGSDPPPP